MFRARSPGKWSAMIQVNACIRAIRLRRATLFPGLVNDASGTTANASAASTRAASCGKQWFLKRVLFDNSTRSRDAAWHGSKRNRSWYEKRRHGKKISVEISVSVTTMPVMNPRIIGDRIHRDVRGKRGGRKQDPRDTGAGYA